MHISLVDKTGDSAVIEYVGGKARIDHDKRFTVMTNEPTYDKQIENLKKYRTFGGDEPLPGERTPSDRFVRAAYYANGLPQPTSRGRGGVHVQCHPQRFGPLLAPATPTGRTSPAPFSGP